MGDAKVEVAHDIPQAVREASARGEEISYVINFARGPDNPIRYWIIQGTIEIRD